jgi:dTMP kinase
MNDASPANGLARTGVRGHGLPGRFLSVEGIDGAGKSTHLDWLAEHCRQSGREVIVTREPGGTPLGERLRELLLHETMGVQTELLLVFAARCEHVNELIRPALTRGAIVICDRFTDSTHAYQGGGRGLKAGWIDQLEAVVLGGLRPDRTYLFDLPADIAARRRAAAREADRFEQEDLDFFERVRAAYSRRVSQDPERFLRLDGRETVDTLRARIADDLATQGLLGHNAGH